MGTGFPIVLLKQEAEKQAVAAGSLVRGRVLFKKEGCHASVLLLWENGSVRKLLNSEDGSPGPVEGSPHTGAWRPPQAIRVSEGEDGSLEAAVMGGLWGL